MDARPVSTYEFTSGDKLDMSEFVKMVPEETPRLTAAEMHQAAEGYRRIRNNPWAYQYRL